MAFNTLEFGLFFCIVLTFSWLLAGWSRLRTYFILGASLYFYASNNSWQTILLIATTTIDYAVCLGMARTRDERKRKTLLLVSLVSNLGMLAFFKYHNFLGENVGRLLRGLGWPVDWVDVNILLPVGISFFTFEALSYTIDVYRRRIDAERDYARLAFLVSFFPHLIAGPIVRASAFFPQIGRRPTITKEELDLALFLVAGGLFKKIVLADGLAPYADAAFSSPEQIGTVMTWIGVYAFAFQIYFDFSGYTDIAIGAAKLLGYDLPVNFRRPYAATSVTDFWRRWHISLSTWLRDYLYISLGGNRMKSRWGVYRNLIITMFLGGLWHGAAWHFAIWGTLHGVWLSVERGLGLDQKDDGAGARPWRIQRLVRIVLIFHGVLLLWLVFRAESLAGARAVMTTMFHFVPGKPDLGVFAIVCVMLVAWFWQIAAEQTNFRPWFLSQAIPVKAVCYVGLLLLVIMFNVDAPQAFIYFRF
jgi:alginate O-acetyltransferase complex protein AlgI